MSEIVLDTDKFIEDTIKANGMTEAEAECLRKMKMGKCVVDETGHIVPKSNQQVISG